MEKKEVFLKILRFGLGRENGLIMSECSDWEALRELSFNHGVRGESLDGLKKTFDVYPNARFSYDQNLHTVILMEWYGYVNLAKKNIIKRIRKQQKS